MGGPPEVVFDGRLLDHQQLCSKAEWVGHQKLCLMKGGYNIKSYTRRTNGLEVDKVVMSYVRRVGGSLKIAFDGRWLEQLTGEWVGYYKLCSSWLSRKKWRIKMFLWFFS